MKLQKMLKEVKNSNLIMKSAGDEVIGILRG